MKKITLQAKKRTELGTQKARDLVRKGFIPAVFYGKKAGKAFSMPLCVSAVAIHALGYNPCFIDLVVDQKTYRCILQDKQVHPVSDIPIHIDLLQISDDQKIVMNIPVRLTGKSVGVGKGGLLISKARKLKIKALPKDMPDHISVDVSRLDLGETIKIGSLPAQNYVICNAASSLIASVEIPRALRSKGASGEGAAATATPEA